ncbi:hypothetical protein J4449_01455 [Candidatus Woesearchaeota archaeon]|nr:hypothetical protein [Candidatus Woesearchaeota archaeon]
MKLEYRVRINAENLTSKALKEIEKNIKKILELPKVFSNEEEYEENLLLFSFKKPARRDINISGKYPDLDYLVKDLVKPFGQERFVDIGYEIFKHNQLSFSKINY